MRSIRRAIEEVYIEIFMEYYRREFDGLATNDASVTDNPDLLIRSKGRLIGIEFSQCPGEYIIQNFHRKMPTPAYTKNKIVGDLFIYPFEPHLWVHDVLKKKSKKVATYRRRTNADEIWLVLHCHSETDEWPMSEKSKQKSREVEALLLRFGTRHLGAAFARIFYVYADGTVVSLRGGLEGVPKAIMLDDDVGYPAVTSHRFAFAFDVPLPGMGRREYKFENIMFNPFIIDPVDSWMAQRKPQIDNPMFRVEAAVDSEEMHWTVFRDGLAEPMSSIDTRTSIGMRLHMHMVLRWSILPTTIHVQF